MFKISIIWINLLNVINYDQKLEILTFGWGRITPPSMLCNTPCFFIRLCPYITGFCHRTECIIISTRTTAIWPHWAFTTKQWLKFFFTDFIPPASSLSKRNDFFLIILLFHLPQKGQSKFGQSSGNSTISKPKPLDKFHKVRPCQ